LKAVRSEVSSSASAPAGVAEVFRELLRHPLRLLVRRWNWKSALLSSTLRAGVFFAANLSAGAGAALAAMSAEFAYRAVTAGFYAALTQAFRYARPAWRATLVAMLLLPAVSHTLEFAVHWLGGTPKLGASIVASVCFTMLSTAFNLYAMRRGAMVVGEGGRPLGDDLRRMPLIIVAFAWDGLKSTARLVNQVINRLSPRAARDRAGAELSGD
jgi:hypothetical protein